MIRFRRRGRDLDIHGGSENHDRDSFADSVEDLVADLDDLAVIDADVPTISNRKTVRLIKQLVKPLIGWYLRYVTQQVTVLGQGTARLGSALAAQGSRLEDATSGLAEEVARLRAKVEGLEAELEGRRPGPQDPS
jgi:hypothetical protein